MKITDYSRFRLQQTALRWHVDRDYFEPIYNYLVLGFEPGSFWTAALANDFMAAMQSCHPSNQAQSLKRAAGWIQNSLPEQSYGSWQKVHDWLKMTAAERRLCLENHGLIYTEQEEVELALRGTLATEPYLVWSS